MNITTKKLRMYIEDLLEEEKSQITRTKLIRMLEYMDRLELEAALGVFEEVDRE
jgi:hypothetical protein